MDHPGLLPGDVDGYVYLARADTGHYKIGRSVDPDDRIKHFDTQMPIDVREYYFFRASDYKAAEKKLHDLCDEHGEHVKGEWWHLPEYMVWWIKEIAYYKDGEFYNREYDDPGPMEGPSESYGNYAKHFGRRAERKSLPSKDAFPGLHK